jgi:hypothetical protein
VRSCEGRANVLGIDLVVDTQLAALFHSLLAGLDTLGKFALLEVDG